MLLSLRKNGQPPYLRRLGFSRAAKRKPNYRLKLAKTTSAKKSSKKRGFRFTVKVRRLRIYTETFYSPNPSFEEFLGQKSCRRKFSESSARIFRGCLVSCYSGHGDHNKFPKNPRPLNPQENTKRCSLFFLESRQNIIECFRGRHRRWGGAILLHVFASPGPLSRAAK